MSVFPIETNWPGLALTCDGARVLCALPKDAALSRDDALALSLGLKMAAGTLGEIEAEIEAILQRWPAPMARAFAERLLIAIGRHIATTPTAKGEKHDGTAGPGAEPDDAETGRPEQPDGNGLRAGRPAREAAGDGEHIRAALGFNPDPAGDAISHGGPQNGARGVSPGERS